MLPVSYDSGANRGRSYRSSSIGKSFSKRSVTPCRSRTWTATGRDVHILANNIREPGDGSITSPFTVFFFVPHPQRLRLCITRCLGGRRHMHISASLFCWEL